MVRPTVVVLGSTNWDISMHLPKLPAPGETVGGGRLHSCLGGKGANQAVACHRAGVPTQFVSCVGSDTIAPQALEALLNTGLAVDHVTQIPDSQTGTACIFVDQQGENCIGLTAGANGLVGADQINQVNGLLTDAAVLLLQLEVPIAAVEESAKMAKEQGIKVILNPAPASAELPEALWSYVDVLTPNRGELSLLSGLPTDTDDQLLTAAKHMLQLGVSALVITLGEQGALLVGGDGDESTQFPSHSVEVVDTTAAGDTFNGYLAAFLALVWNFERAIPRAIEAAALSVTSAGAIPSIPSVDEVNNFFHCD